jgi:hypothetical protein
MSGIITGQDSAIQLGLNSVPGSTPGAGAGWGRASKASIRLPYTGETFKAAPEYKSSEALVGKKTTSRMDIMAVNCDGGFDTYITPDIASFLMYLILGKETVSGSSSPYRHTFTPVPSGKMQSMPGFTAEVNRIMEIVRYPSNKVASAKLSCKPKDYLMLNIGSNGHSDEKDVVLAKSLLTHGAGAGDGSTLVFGDIGGADDDYNGRYVYVPSSGNYYLISDFAFATGTCTVVGATAADRAADVPLEIRAVGMTPGLTVSEQPYYRFIDGILEIGPRVDAYAIGGTGAGVNLETMTVPVAVTGGPNHELYARQTFTTDGIAYTRVWKYIGAEITRSTGTIAFATTPTGTDDCAVLPSATNATWELLETITSEITGVDIDINNNPKTDKFIMDGSAYQAEIQPQGREFKLSLSAIFTEAMANLRKDIYSPLDLVGRTMSVRLTFESPEEVGTTGEPHRLVIFAPFCYMPTADPNISGPDEPEISLDLTATEQGSLEALYIIAEEARSTTVLADATYTPVAWDA